MKQSRLELLTQEAKQLAEKLGPILAELSGILQNGDVKAMQGQLNAIAKSIESLRSASVPIPEELSDRHSDLELRIKCLTQAEDVIAGVARQLAVNASGRTNRSPKAELRKHRTNKGSVSLQDLMEANILRDGASIIHEKKRSGESFQGILRRPGFIEIEIDERIERFDSPSTAGDAISRTSTNGWVYWSVVSENGVPILLNEYRKKFLKMKHDN